jgi:hypothetical protein
VRPENGDQHSVLIVLHAAECCIAIYMYHFTGVQWRIGLYVHHYEGYMIIFFVSARFVIKNSGFQEFQAENPPTEAVGRL